ncbi:MAG: GrpB family protein [Ruminococcus sp.]|nr:GrpB family protein [Ruminococcus sp.]
MGKKLSEMTLEELWHLFPIQLTETKNEWQAYYEEAHNEIAGLLDNMDGIRIHHIGSTAIKGIWAKPIIDILIESSVDDSLRRIAEILEQNGYICMSSDDKRISLNKGYTENGFADKVYHIHIRYMGDNNELYFRDYLNEFPVAAKEYESLKLSLWKQYEFDRDGYTAAKGDFIEKITSEAKIRYKDRY